MASSESTAGVTAAPEAAHPPPNRLQRRLKGVKCVQNPKVQARSKSSKLVTPARKRRGWRDEHSLHDLPSATPPSTPARSRQSHGDDQLRDPPLTRSPDARPRHADERREGTCQNCAGMATCGKRAHATLFDDRERGAHHADETARANRVCLDLNRHALTQPGATDTLGQSRLTRASLLRGDAQGGPACRARACDCCDMRPGHRARKGPASRVPTMSWRALTQPSMSSCKCRHNDPLSGSQTARRQAART